MQQTAKQYVEREIFGEVTAHLDAPEITLITGSRQVGKTILLEQLREHLHTALRVPDERIFFYNLDLVADARIFADQRAFIEFLRARSAIGHLYIFVDEAQKVPEAARFFKGVYDAKLDAKLILTGSASLEAKARFKETLAGRKRIFALSPFTFTELLRARDAFLADALAGHKNIGTIDTQKLIAMYQEYLRFGGYPRVVLADDEDEKRKLLQEIYSSYVEKDAVGFWDVQQPHAFNQLVRLLAAQVGQLVNVGELATIVGIDRATVERYIGVLEETFIAVRVRPFYRNPRQELVKASKLYFLDSGIRAVALERFGPSDQAPEKGMILESAVAAALAAMCARDGGAVLRFWRTRQKAEVDFVVVRGDRPTPIEVKYTWRRETVPPAVRAFMRKYHPHQAMIVSLNGPLAPTTISVDGASVLFTLPFLFEV